MSFNIFAIEKDGDGMVIQLAKDVLEFSIPVGMFASDVVISIEESLNTVNDNPDAF